MKKLFLLLFITVSLSAICQDKKANPVVLETETEYPPADTFLLKGYYFEEWRKDNSMYRIFTMNIQGCDTSFIINDTMRTIKYLIKSNYDLRDRLQEREPIREAAEEVLHYITLDGRIPNKNKFNAAVKKYQQLKAKKKWENFYY